ncbi:hypothetical protein NA57DRAFT_43806 [Rhizodiscina lignyota]|uniref:Erythromycin esterase n=1 Tax=Rhizodiscina lignyota TaxID=1504668 RepID=A0A9P4ICY5_9PEZI|nr:hypothetical protein NA57DRAFT_43806 [Rhizodiscina lignyota]
MTRTVAETVKSAAQKLPGIDDAAFGPCFDKFAKSRVVLIGDASHGTSEFYRARAAITQRLISHHGFNVVGIEGDWPDVRAVDRFVRSNPAPKSVAREPIFKHFPRWMWRNKEMQEFVDWLREHNAHLPPNKRAGVYGLDLYSMGASIKAVIEYLEERDPETAAIARKRYGCLEPWVENPARYGRVALNKGYAPCEKGVVEMLRQLLAKRLTLAMHDGDDFLDAEMNARTVKDSEQYYRAMYYADEDSWNLRDGHMFETLRLLLKVKPGAKAVIWAHNSHVGDARYTSMGQSRGEHNIGQLCKQHFKDSPEDVTIIGCSTHGGNDSTVAAADNWDEPMRIKQVNPSREDSYEHIMHDTGIPSFLLDLRNRPENDEVREALMQPRLERFIGVIYRPDTERYSHYSKAILPRQFDALVWFDRTEAVKAFEIAQPKEELSANETYPFGL